MTSHMELRLEPGATIAAVTTEALLTGSLLRNAVQVPPPPLQLNGIWLKLSSHTPSAAPCTTCLRIEPKNASRPAGRLKSVKKLG